MPPRVNADATLGEKLGVVLCLGIAAMKAVYVLVRYPLGNDLSAQPTLSKELPRVVVRTLLDWLNISQARWVLPSSTAAYKAWISKRAEKEGTPADVVTELIDEDGAKLHWIGNKDAKKVLLHFHSGGFALPLNEGHLSFVNHLRREIIRRSGIDVKAAFLEYSLTPAAGYPTQFRQAVLTLQHILKSGISPADIVISGDSAGGTLVMEVISQYLHPNLSIPSMPIPPVPFAGILAISPWVAFESNAPSFVNDAGDNLSNRLLRYFAELVLQNSVPTDTKGVPEEYWREPLRAPPDWWRGSEKVTKHIMFVYGERETLRDDIVSLVEKVREGVSGAELDIAIVQDPLGVHIAPVIDALLNRAPSETTKTIAEWVHDRIAT